MVGKVTFGFEDPSWTGLGTGLLSMLYQWYPKRFSIHPDFEREILEGELHIRGQDTDICTLSVSISPVAKSGCAFRCIRNGNNNRRFL